LLIAFTYLNVPVCRGAVNSITGNEHQLLMNIVIKNSTGDKADALPSMAVCYQCIQSIIECFDICCII